MSFETFKILLTKQKFGFFSSPGPRYKNVSSADWCCWFFWWHFFLGEKVLPRIDFDCCWFSILRKGTKMSVGPTLHCLSKLKKTPFYPLLNFDFIRMDQIWNCLISNFCILYLKVMVLVGSIILCVIHFPDGPPFWIRSGSVAV